MSRIRRVTPEEEDELRGLAPEWRQPFMVAATPDVLIYAQGAWFMHAAIGKPARWTFRGAVVARVPWFQS